MAVKRKKRVDPAPALQIAPMIDCVFLLLIYFMVSSTLEKQEADVSFQLPGTVEQSEPLELPDEQIVEIRADGQVVWNDRTLDRPGGGPLPELTGVLRRFREASVANRVEPALTVAPDPAATQQSIVRVLDAAARAGIRNVSFALGDEG